MPAPPQGFIKIYPETVSIVQAVNGWSLNSDPGPMPARSVGDLQAYFDTRVVNLAVAPCIRRDFESPGGGGIYAPSVNTYELSFSPSSRGIEFFANSIADPPDATLDFLHADFPTGLSINQASLWWDGFGRFDAARERDLGSLSWKYGGITFNTMALTGGWGGQTTPATGAGSIIPSFLTNWSIIQLMKIFGISVPVTASGITFGLTPEFVISDFFLYAVYNTLQFEFTNNITPNAIPGDIATLESDSGSMGIFDANSFKIYWDTRDEEEDVNPLFPGWTGGVLIPNRNIITLNADLLKFIMPTNLGIPYGGRRLMLTGTGDGITFIGESPLANYNVLLVDGSGLYQLTSGQRHDTYYNRDTVPITEIDLKFPRPRFKTGFV